MSRRLLIGLPSFNEAGTIASVTRDVDEALADLPFPVSAVLVNADNSSTDGTADAFLATPTRWPKRVISTPYGSGKGTNWRALMQLIRDGGFDLGLLIDTDLGAVPASWIHALAAAVAGGSDFAFPLRPPRWNGGDLTYQLAYPVLAGTFGADLPEPLCGDIAISRQGAERVLEQRWISSDYRFGVDALVASVALTTGSWQTVALHEQRRNKLRSFTAGQCTGHRMGAKFAEVAHSLRHRCRLRMRQPMPDALQPGGGTVPAWRSEPAPREDPDITRLAAATTRRLAEDLDTGIIGALPKALADPLAEHVSSGACEHGLPWWIWRDVLFAWLNPATGARITIDLLETLFLNRVVGHHTEIKGTSAWYDTVRRQAFDFFAHRASVWEGLPTTPTSRLGRRPVVMSPRDGAHATLRKDEKRTARNDR